MHSTPAPRETDPHDIFVIEPDVVLAARADRTSTNAKPDGRASGPQGQKMSDILAGASAPSLDATFRAAAVDNNVKVPIDRAAPGKWARRALMSFLFALCSAFAAAGWTHYGDAAKAMVMSFAPRFVLTASPPQENPEVAEQPPVPQAAAADQVAEQPAAAAQSAQSVAPPVAALPGESAQLLQSMQQQIEQLKASIEQLKAGQEQMSRDIARNSETRTALARTSEQILRSRIAAPPPRSAVVAPVRKPRPAFAPAQAAAAPLLPLPPAAAAPVVVPLQPAPPAQATAQPDGEPVLRPPLPVR
jgi:hypothetical protein